MTASGFRSTVYHPDQTGTVMMGFGNFVGT